MNKKAKWEHNHIYSQFQDTLVGKAIKRRCGKDKNACQLLFNSAYYLGKQEQPFSDFPDLLKLQKKNKMPGIKECYRNDRATGNFTGSIAKVTKDSFAKDLAKARYFYVPIGGSTDSGITGEELVYVLFL